MKKLSFKILGFFANPQFGKFLVVGALGTALDYSAYLSLTRFLGVWYLLASVAGFACGLTNNFFWNKYWTFERREAGLGREQFVKFFIVSIAGLAWGNGLFFALVEWGHLHDVAARIIMTLAVTLWNFSVNKLWTFRLRTRRLAADSTDVSLGE